MAKAKGSEKWIQNAIKPENKGKLHKALKVPANKRIPLAKLEKAEKSKNPTIRHEAQLAETLGKLRKKK